MSALVIDPEIEKAISVPDRPLTGDSDADFAIIDRPAQFGDDCMDSLQGILNIARNATLLMDAPTLPRVPCPAISVGGGPSLARHLDALRELQHKCVIVCSQTSIDGLIAAGITPHLATPIERGAELASDRYLPKGCGKVTFSGAPLVNPSVCAAFGQHRYAASLDALYAWTSLDGEGRNYFGSSTGVTATSIACNLSKQVYLVGHDLAYAGDDSHWAGSNGDRMDPKTNQIYPIVGNDGSILRTTHLYRRLEDQLRAVAEAHGHVVNVNAHYHEAARIRSTLSGPLPDAGDLPDWEMPAGDRVPERKAAWKRRAKKLPYSAKRCIQFFEAAKDLSPESTHIQGAGQGLNGQCLGYLLTSIFAQISYECRMRTIRPHVALDWLKTATRNVLKGSADVFEEIAEHGHSC